MTRFRFARTANAISHRFLKTSCSKYRNPCPFATMEDLDFQEVVSEKTPRPASFEMLPPAPLKFRLPVSNFGSQGRYYGTTAVGVVNHLIGHTREQVEDDSKTPRTNLSAQNTPRAAPQHGRTNGNTPRETTPRDYTPTGTPRAQQSYASTNRRDHGPSGFKSSTHPSTASRDTSQPPDLLSARSRSTHNEPAQVHSLNTHTPRRARKSAPWQ